MQFRRTLRMLVYTIIKVFIFFNKANALKELSRLGEALHYYDYAI